MGIRAAGKSRRKKEEPAEKWERVIGNMDKLIGVRVSTLNIRNRVGRVKGGAGKLSRKEADELPKAAEFAASLRDALNSGSLRRIDGVA